MFDPDLYRDPEEVERWKQRDPITTFAGRLVTDGVITDTELEAMWNAARDETEAAVVAADAAPVESVDTLLDHVTRPTDRSSVPPARVPRNHVENLVPGDPGAGDEGELDEVWP